MSGYAVTIRKIRSNFHSLQDVLLFLRMSSLVLALPAMLRLLSIPGLLKLLTPRTTINSQNPVTDMIVKCTDYLLSRDVWMFRSTCLRRSLVLYHFLRRAGIDVQICFGVKYREKIAQEGSGMGLEGHAWLLYKGEIFLETNAVMTRAYSVTYRYPAEGDRASKDGLEFTGEQS